MHRTLEAIWADLCQAGRKPVDMEEAERLSREAQQALHAALAHPVAA